MEQVLDWALSPRVMRRYWGDKPPRAYSEEHAARTAAFFARAIAEAP